MDGVERDKEEISGGSKAVKYKAVLSSHDLKLLVPQEHYQEVSRVISSRFDDSIKYTIEPYLHDKSQIVREVGRYTATGRRGSESVDISIEVIVDYNNIWSDITILSPPNTNSGSTELGVK